ncbi:MAG TPA: alpha/beta hydrolase [Opitutaceae bacterium]|jgi:endo-1,4-beta-xylanase|nr:alpha/beta hydrolase [Opitutaceae bacterium]
MITAPRRPRRTQIVAWLGLAALAALPLRAQERAPVLHLWENGAPGFEARKDWPEKVVTNPAGVTELFSLQITSIHNPSVTAFLPAKGKGTGAGVVILPGGGHRLLSIEHEGYAVAQWLSEHGVAGFVLKYRLAKEPGSTYRVEVEGLQDTQRALRLVRAHAAEWNLDPARIGIMGFSAGGELAALASAQSGAGNSAAADLVERESARPAFQALIYPGVPDKIQPTRDSPPAFLAAGSDDKLSEGVAQIYLRFRAAGVPAEVHIYCGVGHGFGFRPTNIYPYRTWLERFREWLDVGGFLAPR